MQKILWIFVFMITFFNEPIQTQEVTVRTETIIIRY